MINYHDIAHWAKNDWEKLYKGDKPIILVGTATCGRSAGGLEVLAAFQNELKKKRINAHTIEVGCIGLCYAEPLVTIIKPQHPAIVYGNITPEKVPELIQGYLLNHDPLSSYALGTIGEGAIEKIPNLFTLPSLKPQKRKILRNCGLIDPLNINHYIAHGGYSGLTKALTMSPEEILEGLKLSGLRGRGGAGFPTWQKWQFCKQAQGKEKYLICNGSEGDPGTFSNKLLFESDPHSVLEGMLIAAYTINVQQGYIYCPAEYPLALEKLEAAIKQMEKYGLLGDNILGANFNFHIKIKQGAGAYICGEETALIECIEGKRGIPRLRPPFPPISGLWNKPTVINNVETLACVTLILQNGARWFAGLGTEKSKGTKLFCLSGNIKYSGVIEVAFGSTLQEIVYDIGGGTFDNKPIKAVQTGGPGGGCLPANLLNITLDHDSLSEFDSSMGSGGIIVIDVDNCIVDIALNFLEFTQRECCGACVPCRLGTKQMLQILEDITKGKSRQGDIDLLLELGESLKLAAFCGLGQTASNPVMSTIRYFREEYEAHINNKKCPAAVCREINNG